MKFEPKDPPRVFRPSPAVEISDCGNILLQADEQVTFVTPSGKEHDVAAKEWGFYATPSVNGRLQDQGFKTALVRNAQGRHYVMVVEVEKLEQFQGYLEADDQQIVEWLDERD